MAVIKEYMENEYNDELLPENFEQIAKAYSASLKSKGFVFVRLEEEEQNLLVGEIFVIIAKMKACIDRLEKCLEAGKLVCRLDNAYDMLSERFCNKKPHNFTCVESVNNAFLSLIALENMLIIKLMLLSVKSEEVELCNNITTSITSVFAESFSLEGFVAQD